MATPEPNHGVLILEYGNYPADSADAVVPIDVIGEDFHEVTSAPKVLELGKPVRLTLEPGSYLVRAYLPSGEIVARQARVEPGGQAVVSILPSKPSPRESLTWAYILKNVPDGGRAATRSMFESTRHVPRRGGEVVSERSGIEMTLWSHAVSPQNSWQRVEAGLTLDESAAPNDPNALAEASVDVPAGQYWLEVRGGGFPTRFVALAPNGSRRTHVLVVADDRSEPAFDPIDVMVNLGNRRAEAILSFLSLGSLEEAKRLGESLVDQAETMLAQKVADPIAATVAGYYLLKASALDRLHDWTANLANMFTWLPDGPVIRAWHLLRLPEPDPKEIRTLLVDAAARGLPLFTQGLRMLHDGLGLLARSEPDDLSTSGALQSIRPYTAAANWSALTTTFYGSDPKQPRLPSQSAIYELNQPGRRPVRALIDPKIEAQNAGAPGPTKEQVDVLRCLDQIVPSTRRRMLESVFKHGLTPEAAGSELGIQSNYVETQLVEAMRELRSLMSNLDN
jgi:hypothetical protein